jgi:hypothetical protein
MRRLSATLLILAASLNAQWYNPFSWGSGVGTPAPPAVVNCAIQDRTFEPGSKPRVEEKDWKACPGLLTNDFSVLQLANVKDPEDFTAARLKLATPPTKAYWRNEFGLTKTSEMSPAHLSTESQAYTVIMKVQGILVGVGVGLCPLKVIEHNPINAFSQPVYSGADWKEERRHWYVQAGHDNFNVGLIRQAYATAPVESVAKGLAAELVEACK